MSASLDLSRAPLGERAAAKLVEAVAAGDDRLERHYLEVKSDLNLTQKNDVTKIAKYILGSANRLPETAARAFEGYGVMIIGVAPGDARGVPPIEVLEIDKVVSQYIGASGPHWDVVRVPVEGSANEVLVVVVDPPIEGQRPFPCRKEGADLKNGRIYVRADGETREAKADELDRLLDRAATQAAPDVSFEVAVMGYAYPLEVDEEATLESHIARVTGELLRALPQPDPKQTPEIEQASAGTMTISGGNDFVALTQLQLSATSRVADIIKKQQPMFDSLFDVEPEARTEDEYRSSIEQWGEKFRAKWPGAVDVIAGHALECIGIRIKNPTKTFFHDVEVKIHLEGDVRGVDFRGDGEELSRSDLALPVSPRSWGPIYHSKFDERLIPSQIVPDIYAPSTYHSSLDWNNSDSVELKLHVGELRPRDEYIFDEDEIILIVPLMRDISIHGTWEITARDHNEVYSGELTVEVGPPVDLTSNLRTLLDIS